VAIIRGDRADRVIPTTDSMAASRRPRCRPERRPRRGGRRRYHDLHPRHPWHAITAIANRAILDDVADEVLRRTFPLAMLQAAIPKCISLRLDSGDVERWVTLDELTTTGGHIIPQ